MAVIAHQVPYGYEPPKDQAKGTLIYYDTFEESSDRELAEAVQTVIERSFARLVLYPIHEETARRMSKEPVSAYYKREKRLLAWMQDNDLGEDIAFVSLDGWEGKRKKYTPIDAALRHLTETLPPPHFLLLSPTIANQFASFDSFESWIGRIRLLLLSEPVSLHPRLEQNRSRWSLT